MVGQSDVSERLKFKGDILLCEDNEINQHVVKSHLERLGFHVVIANNGKESIDIVLARMKNGEAPFGLIFMDIYMPVMDGTQAANELIRLESQTPVVALASNTTPNDIKTYRDHGMTDFLNKPFTMDELLSCLCKYFIPLGFAAVEEEKSKDEEEKRRRLLTNFVKRNQTTYDDISAAIKEGDIKLAHRLAHTLKGLAGLMGKTSLRDAADIVEYSLMNERMEHINEEMSMLAHELTPVLEELLPLLLEQNSQETEKVVLDKDRAAEVFEKLSQLLIADSTKCLGLVDELRKIPETGILISQIEDYEFEIALETLISLKKCLDL